jgi:hypothetical protein
MGYSGIAEDVLEVRMVMTVGVVMELSYKQVLPIRHEVRNSMKRSNLPYNKEIASFHSQ